MTKTEEQLILHKARHFDLTNELRVVEQRIVQLDQLARQEREQRDAEVQKVNDEAKAEVTHHPTPNAMPKHYGPMSRPTTTDENDKD